MACMNIVCATTSSPEWKKAWTLRTGEFALLCHNCGSAYELGVFCDTFHADDSGWRECVTCGKRLHCGCIASKSLMELLDSGGVKCFGCASNSGHGPNSVNEKPSKSGTSTVNGFGIKRSDNYTVGSGIDQLSVPRNLDSNRFLGQMKREEAFPPLGESRGKCFSNLGQSSKGIFQKEIPDIAHIEAKSTYGSLAHPNLGISLGGSSGHLHFMPGVVAEEKEQSKTSSAFQQGLVSHRLVSKPPKIALSPGFETNASMASPIRVARPPVEGRGRHQLLPRYWPRITEQELQQISGVSNCTIVPLFEKVLSASDAGRIGRLVLPKACAEAYFPPISQPEGLPLRIQDVKGKEWMFQFRFWPNNNSRMYVLEGVTPCIQSMQLQAGDTVTFSRMDPEGKLVMGFRKASNSVDTQSLKGPVDPHLNALSSQLDSNGRHISWNDNGAKTADGMLIPAVMPPERKKSRNISSKSKRLLIDSQEVLELRLTWEEVQDMLRPPEIAKPSIVTIEDFEIEEYEEPPVFGKRSFFAARSSGEIEQWAQCDSCSKWRRLPVDILLPPKWTCAENVWDLSRCSCSAPDELSPRDLENFLQLSKDFKKRRIAMGSKTAQEQESTGLDDLANAAALVGNASDPGSSSVATTTKHPRHRPGCSCIVCIQPPSGKGKHKPNCNCNVCMTVKRRFKTLMMRKQKRQTEQEAEIALRNHQQKPSHANKDEKEIDSTVQQTQSHLDHPPEDETAVVNEPQTYKGQTAQTHNPASISMAESGPGLDLNCHPEREEEPQEGLARVSMTSLLQLASRPLETYMKQNGLSSLTPEQAASSGSHVQQVTTGEAEGLKDEDHCEEQENAGNEGCEPEECHNGSQNDAL